MTLEHDHDNLGEQLSAYLDGELTDLERQDVEQVLATDDRARTLLDGLRRSSHGLRALPRADAPGSLLPDLTAALEARRERASAKPVARQHWLRRLRGPLAAAAVLAFAVSGGWWALVRMNPTPRERIAPVALNQRRSLEFEPPANTEQRIVAGAKELNGPRASSPHPVTDEQRIAAGAKEEHELGVPLKKTPSVEPLGVTAPREVASEGPSPAKTTVAVRDEASSPDDREADRLLDSLEMKDRLAEADVKNAGAATAPALAESLPPAEPPPTIVMRIDGAEDGASADLATLRFGAPAAAPAVQLTYCFQQPSAVEACGDRLDALFGQPATPLVDGAVALGGSSREAGWQTDNFAVRPSGEIQLAAAGPEQYVVHVPTQRLGEWLTAVNVVAPEPAQIELKSGPFIARGKQQVETLIAMAAPGSADRESPTGRYNEQMAVRLEKQETEQRGKGAGDDRESAARPDAAAVGPLSTEASPQGATGADARGAGTPAGKVPSASQRAQRGDSSFAGGAAADDGGWRRVASATAPTSQATSAPAAHDDDTMPGSQPAPANANEPEPAAKLHEDWVTLIIRLMTASSADEQAPTTAPSSQPEGAGHR